jgi:hypothetical protein
MLNPYKKSTQMQVEQTQGHNNPYFIRVDVPYPFYLMAKKNAEISA